MSTYLFDRGLIVSCQATPEEPMFGSDIMARMAIAAQMGGAVAVRVNTVNDIIAVKAAVSIPVIGLLKRVYDGYWPYITSTMKEVEEVVKAGADMIAIDATRYDRADGKTLKEFVHEIRNQFPHPILADVSTVEEGIYAQSLGVDMVATTLSGYTPDTVDQDSDKIVELREPDFELIKGLKANLSIPIVAEGRLWNEESAIKAMESGAYAVTIGAGITRPQIITKKIVDEIQSYLSY